MVEVDSAVGVEHGAAGQLLLFLDLLLGESPDEDGRSVPDDLEYFSGGQFGDIDLHVGVAVVRVQPLRRPMSATA